VLLLAACVGGIVLSTVPGRRAEAPLAGGTDGPVVLARAEPHADLGEPGGRRGGTFARAVRTPAGPGSRGSSVSAAEGAAALPKGGKGIAPAPRPTPGGRDERPKHGEVLASLKDKLVKRFGGVAGTPPHALAHEIDLPVGDLATAKEQVVAVLAEAEVPPLGFLETRPAARVRAVAGRPAPTDELRFYHAGPAGPRSFLYVVVDTNENLTHVSRAVRELRASWQEAAPGKPLCVGSNALRQSTAPAPPPRTPAPAPTTPPTTQQQQPYHVAQIRPLPDDAKPSSAPASGPATAPAGPVPALLIITVRLRPDAPTTTSQAVLNVKQ
jgi:hypothetical protein